MRNSDWRVVWNPLGDSPMTLLGFDQLMEDEHARNLEQLVDVGRFDFARSGLPVSRGNVKKRLEFSRRDEHPSAGASWDACQTAIISDPWGQKKLLQVQGRGGIPRLYTAALLSSSHQPSTGFELPESVHHYAFRIAPRASTLDDGIAVLGGYIYSQLTLIIDPDQGLDIHRGDVVLVQGVKDVGDGNYIVIKHDGGELIIEPGALGYGSPPPTGDDDLELLEMVNVFPSSPAPSPPSPPDYFLTSLHREVKFTSAIYFQYWDGSGWVDAAPGINLLSGSLDPYATVGYWNGLSPVSGERVVTYPSKTSEIRVRRMGETGSGDSIFIRVAGKGKVTFLDGHASVSIFKLEPATASYGPEGGLNYPSRGIPPGGTVRKVNLEGGIQEDDS